MAPSLRRRQACCDLRRQYRNFRPSPRPVQQSTRTAQPTMYIGDPGTPVDVDVPASIPIGLDVGTTRGARNTDCLNAPCVSLLPSIYDPNGSKISPTKTEEPFTPSSNGDTIAAQVGGSTPIEALSLPESPTQLGNASQQASPGITPPFNTAHTSPDPYAVNEDASIPGRRRVRPTTSTSTNQPRNASDPSADQRRPQSGRTNITTPGQSPPPEPIRSSKRPAPAEGRSDPAPMAGEDDPSDAASDSTEIVGTSAASPPTTEEIPRTNPNPWASLQGERVHWVSISTVRQVTTQEMTVIELWRERVPRNDEFDDNDSICQSSRDNTAFSHNESARSEEEGTENADQVGGAGNEAADTADGGYEDAQCVPMMRDQGTQTDHENSPAGGEGVEAATSATANEDSPVRGESEQTDGENPSSHHSNWAGYRAQHATLKGGCSLVSSADVPPLRPNVEHAAAAPAESSLSTAAPASADQEDFSPRENPLRISTPIGSELECCRRHNKRFCCRCAPGYASSGDESDEATPGRPSPSPSTPPRPPPSNPAPPSLSPSPSFTPGDDAPFQRTSRIRNGLRGVRSDLKKRVVAAIEKHALSTQKRTSHAERLVPGVVRRAFVRAQRWVACKVLDRKHARNRPLSVEGENLLARIGRREPICEAQGQERKMVEQYYDGRLRDLKRR